MLVVWCRWRCRETLMILLHTLFLVQRTVLSVMVARLDGRIVRDLVKADKNVRPFLPFLFRESFLC